MRKTLAEYVEKVLYFIADKIVEEFLKIFLVAFRHTVFEKKMQEKISMRISDTGRILFIESKT